MDNGVPPIEQRPVERRATERRSTPRAAASGSGERRKTPPKPRKPQTATTETVADRIDPLMHASAPPPQRPPASPRKRAPAARPPVKRQPTAAIDVSEQVATELPTAEPTATDPVAEQRVAADLDFFDDIAVELLDFEKRVAQQVEAPEPYVLPKIIPGEPEPAADEPPMALVPTEPGLERAWRKLKLRAGFRPQFTRVAQTTKKLARSLQPVVLPRHRPRVRRVTRVVRHIDTWSVFKIAVLFNIFLYAVCLTAGAMLWRVALNTGTIENIERFFESFGWQTFELKGGEIYHNAWIAGLFGVVGLTGLAVLAATMFNLITDLVGGVRVTVLEEEVTAREQHVVKWPRLLRPATPPHDKPPIN